jgi:hypothetical protein
MSPQTKSVRGQLFNIENNNILMTEVTVEISLLPPPYSVERHKYKATLTLKGYKPELSEKAYKLKLSEKISGRVFITSSVVDFDTEQTRFNLTFEDAVWRGHKWFKSL